jgi:DnaJ family protein C protein 11
MATSLEDDEEKDGYYSLLNVSKEASPEQINAAYRRMCIIYHPDKHDDPDKKTAAETLFGRLKEAHAVLSDPEKRIIYDVYGKKGLEASWELVPRTRTQSEIREEYERLQRRQEEERLQQATNPRGKTSVAINATDIFDSYGDDYETGQLEISSITMSQQIDAPLTRKDTLTLSGTLVAKNGRGHGQVGAILRHVVTPSKWFEVDCGAGTGLFLGGRLFMNLTRFTYGMAGIGFVHTQAGLQPVVTGSLTRRLSDHTSGSLVWKSGDEQSMTSSVVMDTENHRLALTFQLGVPDIHARFSYVYKHQQDTRAHAIAKAGTMGVTLEYGLDTKITEHSWVGASVAVGVPIGVRLKVK